MESNSFFFEPTQARRSSRKTVVALFAGLAILGAVVFVALNTTQSLNGQAFFSHYTQEEEEAFASFLKTYRKTYLTSNERVSRLGVFAQNYRLIKATNADEKLTYEVAVNEFADMTLDEFAETRLGVDASLHDEKLASANEISLNKELLTDLPASVDLRYRLQPILNQGGCGSCWSYSALASLEARYYNVTQKIIALSQQELVDCSRVKYRNNGCGGGMPDRAYMYIMDNGIGTQANYPYKGVNQVCGSATVPRATKLKTYFNIKANDNDSLKIIASEQVVSITVQSKSHGWQFYSKGILNANCGTSIDHAVNIVGYGTDAGNDYWLVRNSWGQNWGESGYIRIARVSGMSKGVCGVAQITNFAYELVQV